jgi:predicted SprT family Zn-dependent metalloprotease
MNETTDDFVTNHKFSEKEKSVLHEGYTCYHCKQTPIKGPRFEDKRKNNESICLNCTLDIVL